MKNLPHTNVFCRVGISKISGVGLIAIIPIPKDTIIFTGKEPPSEIVPRKIVNELPSGQRKLYEDFAVLDGNNYICPNDLSELTVGWFFNNSSNPNVGCRTLKTRSGGFDFFALGHISVGEELTIEYDAYEKLYLQLHHQNFAPKRKSFRKS
jgi:hypothetical protein